MRGRRAASSARPARSMSKEQHRSKAATAAPLTSRLTALRLQNRPARRPENLLRAHLLKALPRHEELLRDIHASARRLLAIPKRSLENQNMGAVHMMPTAPKRKEQRNSLDRLCLRIRKTRAVSSFPGLPVPLV